MKLRILTAVAVFAAVMSGHAFAIGLEIGLDHSRPLCLKSFGCDQHNGDSGKSENKDRAEKTEDVRDDAWYEKHSRYIRWTVIRNRSEGMPEECRYFYCDLEHYSSGRMHEPSNGWIITLPRNMAAPEGCKFSYCRKVYTESDTRPAINTMYRGTGLDR